jgi:hypothetical protein
MNSKTKLFTFATVTLSLCSLTISTVLANKTLTNQSKLVINGIGSVRVGMTVSQAAKASGRRLIGDRPNNNCYYVGSIVTAGRISRVDVWKNTRITTLRGAKIGDTEARIKSLYPGKIQVTPHKYVQEGHYLTFVPSDRADQNYRVVFETDGKQVTRFRSGKLPEVEFVEGCS